MVQQFSQKVVMIAKHFTENAQIGMIGVNVPIPVPVAYHSFGGWKTFIYLEIIQCMVQKV